MNIHSRNSVSPIQATFPRSYRRTNSPVQHTAALQVPSNGRKASWLPFTLQWYFLVIPISLSLCFGGVLVYLVLYSKRNYGLGLDNGSSGILFGWRFTPTLIAVLYAQMTVILFEDLKRTEPFARLASAPVGGTSAYGTILQTPRAWWAIFMDVCFRRKRVGTTTWSLVCAAVVNVIALIAISPLSSALFTSEEVLVPKRVNFERIIPRTNTPLQAVPTRETYFRTMSAATMNVSTSVWVTDSVLAFPFFPKTEAAQFGPSLVSSYSRWSAETTTVKSTYECQDMKLESANVTSKRYSNTYTTQGYGPINGTQPMVTFVLTHGSGCRYELSVHPAADIAVAGGVTWSNATTFFPTTASVLPIGGITGGRIHSPNVTATDIYARVNATEQCKGRDIIIMSTPWTAPTFEVQYGFVPTNQTFDRSPDFSMRAMLCQSRYFVANSAMNALISGGSETVLNTSTQNHKEYREASNSDDIIDVPAFQALSMGDDWSGYFDQKSILIDTAKTAAATSGFKAEVKNLGFSGMGPLLAAASGFNISYMMQDSGLAQRAASLKGRFFQETLREVFNKPKLVETEDIVGEGTMVETRVVVLAEIAITLASLFFASSILLSVIFWRSRLAHRPLNLTSDPSSTIGLSLMINQRLSRSSTLQSMHGASQVDLYTALQREKYLTSNDSLIKAGDDTSTPIKIKAKRNWRPRVIHVRMLTTLGVLLTIILVAVLVLNAFSGRAQLSQVAWIYEADISRLKLSFSSFAPISIAPTVISIMVSLWWDQLDMAFRILQPFISMSHGPTSINRGAGLTYRSKSWVGAAIKAGRNKHWVLLMIAIGSVLAQILTVSMSALFERKPHNVDRQVSFANTLELRQTPILSEFDGRQSLSNTVVDQVLNKLYLDASKNWLYGAGIQQSFNGSQLPWTCGGWSFVPVDLSHDSSLSNTDPSIGNIRNDVTASASNNVTIKAPAIRVRLDCTSIPEAGNASSWIERTELSEEYGPLPEDYAMINETGGVELYTLPDSVFANTSSHTFVKEKGCCGNGSLEDPQRAVSGYWTPVLATDWKKGPFPYEYSPYPFAFVSKWIVGKPLSVRQRVGGSATLFYRELPRLQAARCQPIIETGEASLMLDRKTGQVHTYRVDKTVSAGQVPWANVFTKHQSALGFNGSSRPLNITTSYGVLFLDALFAAADRPSISAPNGLQLGKNSLPFTWQDPGNGLNMDLMTYSMYTLAEKDPDALLNYTTFVKHADTTFQTFFQHFVNSGLSLNEGGFAYQPIMDNSTNSIRRSIHSNGSLLEETAFPTRYTNRTITGTVSRRIHVLHMNVIATYISVGILIWLIFTTVIVIVLQRKYTSSMNRDVQLIADMLVLVAGSDNLLELVQTRGEALKRDTNIETMLGWFKDRNGEIRWGVEVVGGRNAVEWVDAPKTGWHVRSKTSWGAKNPSWRPSNWTRKWW